MVTVDQIESTCPQPRRQVAQTAQVIGPGAPRHMRRAFDFNPQRAQRALLLLNKNAQIGPVRRGIHICGDQNTHGSKPNQNIGLNASEESKDSFYDIFDCLLESKWYD